MRHRERAIPPLIEIIAHQLAIVGSTNFHERVTDGVRA